MNSFVLLHERFAVRISDIVAVQEFRGTNETRLYLSSGSLELSLSLDQTLDILEKYDGVRLVGLPVHGHAYVSRAYVAPDAVMAIMEHYDDEEEESFCVLHLRGDQIIVASSIVLLTVMQIFKEFPELRVVRN
jgi:hypothetical protein